MKVRALVSVIVLMVAAVGISSFEGIVYGDSKDMWRAELTNPSQFCDTVTVIPQAECEALVTIFNTTQGQNWTNKTGWLQTNDPCTWYGVQCGVNGPPGHITKLILNNNQLNGTISPAVGDFNYLFLLNLRGNQLSGAIPTVLGGINSLDTLDLGDNQLSGNISAQLGNLSLLNKLYLNGNQLYGSIPSQLGQLQNLDTLYLQYNNLSGNIPPELGYLNDLKELNLAANQLSGSIPGSLGSLNNLEQLVLYSNQLNGGIPYQISQLNKLQTLSICDNQLNGGIPQQLGNLSKLKILCLHTNGFSGNLPSDLGSLSQLEKLWLNSNLFNGSIPQSFTNLTSLTYFNFQNTNLCEPVNPAFQNWLAGIDTVLSNGIDCESTPTPTPTPGPTSTLTPTPTMSPTPTQTPTITPTPDTPGTFAFLYTPLIANNAITYFEDPMEQEPNDTIQLSNGPLRLNQVYQGAPNDMRDFFSFYLPNSGEILINLHNHVGTDVQIQLYYKSTENFITYDPEPPFELRHEGEPGMYYIYIFSANNYANVPYYNLTIVFQNNFMN